MKKYLKLTLIAVALVVAISSFVLTRDGKLVTPSGQGVVSLPAGDFEAFPLPAYASDALGGEYKSYFVEVAEGIKIHVLEIGEGQPVYLQHGLPTSGLLYRQVAAKLPHDEYRLIMPTLVGLGFSSKIPASWHSIENHISWTNTLLSKLDLKDLIFVPHDWGGPIGAGALSRSPDLMAGMVVLNTVLDAPKAPRDAPTALKVVQTPVLGEFIMEGVTSMFAFLPGSQNDPATMSPDVIALYSTPLKEDRNSKGPLAFMRMSVLSPENPDTPLLLATEDYVRNRPVPTEIVWGVNDPVLGARLSDMQALLPSATLVETEAGHFLQEEVPAEIAASIQRVHLRMQSEN
jgi:haloalkane dehalogenase